METYKIFNNLLTVLIILTYNNNNVIFASEVTCSLEDYILTGIEFRQCQSKILDTFETARGGNPCKLIKSIVDSCSTIVKVGNVYYFLVAEFILFLSGKNDFRIFFLLMTSVKKKEWTSLAKKLSDGFFSWKDRSYIVTRSSVYVCDLLGHTE